MEAQTWECCLDESPECRAFETPEDLIDHLFQVHQQYLCCECHSFVTQSEDDYFAHIDTHKHENRNGDDNNNTHNDKDNESCDRTDTRRHPSSNTDSSRPTSSKRDIKKRNQNQSEPSESSSKRVDEESPPILEAIPPFASPISNNFSSSEPDLIPVSSMQSRSKTSRQLQTRLNSQLTETVKKPTITDEKSTSNTTKSLRKRVSPSSGINEDDNEASTIKNTKMMDTTPVESTITSYQCGDCNKSFKTQIDLATHLLSHNTVKLESSRSSSGLSLSRSSISEENDISEDNVKDVDSLRVYCCPVCGKKEYDEKELFIHFSKNHKNPDNRNYGCPGSVRNHVGKLLACPKLFQNVLQLYQHMNNHHDEQSSQTTANNNNTPPSTTTTTTLKSNILIPKKSGRGRKKKKATSSITISSSKTSTKSPTPNDERNDKNYHPETSDSDTSIDERNVKSKSNIPSNNHNIRPRSQRNNVIETPVISHHQRENPTSQRTVPPNTRVNTKKSTEFPCGDDCPAQYTDLKQLHEHRLKKHPTKTFHVCIQCNYIPYSSLSGLQKHQNERH